MVETKEKTGVFINRGQVSTENASVLMFFESR